MLISTDSVTFCATKDYQLKTDRTGIKKKKLSNDASHWGSPCMVGVIMQDVHWNIVERICTPSSMSWSKGVRPYLQSIFSTRYAHIRKPVRLKPCVQWTPLGEKKRGSTEVKNSDFNHFIFTFILFAMGEYAQSHKSCQSIFRPMYAQRLHIINLM